MGAKIKVRAYVVGFGDCVLLRLPDGNETRTMLVDFGRAPNDSSSLARFPAIAADIESQCNGVLDVLVMTHEHLDHMEGFYREREVFSRMRVKQVWMSLPSHPEYYEQYRNAQPQKRLRAALAGFAENARRNGMALHPGFQSLVENNLANADRVRYLRTLGRTPVAYLARGKSDGEAASFPNIKVTVLAPEPDVSVYYGGSRRHALAAAMADAGDEGAASHGETWNFPKVARAAPEDFAGLSRSDFDRLRRTIREDGVTAARFIDRAANNTSLCLLIEAAGKRLLLPGDAELESWAVMKERCAAEFAAPVDFLKVSHHGSHNGTPLDMLDALLPRNRKDKAQVLVSTKKNVYGVQNPVPDTSLLEELQGRCRKLVTTDGETGTFVELEI